MHGKLYIAPLIPAPESRVLDVGTGLGIWAIEFAHKIPSTQVIGIDLLAVQSTTSVPANSQFQIVNAEKDWALPQPLDLIHSRLLCFGMHNWPGYFHRCFSNLKPGGWIDAQGLTFRLHCDDGSAKSDSVLMR